MPTLRELKAKMIALSGRCPGVDPSEDARRIFGLIGSMAGILGCDSEKEQRKALLYPSDESAS